MTSITGAVINPNLIELFQATDEVSGLSKLPYWTLVRGSMDNLVGAVDAFQNTNWSADLQRQQQHPAGSIVLASLTALDVRNVTSPQGILDAVRSAGMELFSVQHAALVGTQRQADGSQTYTPAQAAYLRPIITKLIEKLMASMPLSITPPCDDATRRSCRTTPEVGATLTDFFRAAKDVVRQTLFADMNDAAQQVEMFFPPAVADFMVEVALAPWVILSYIASFMRGPWNKAQRTDASFYDQKYAELLLFTTISGALMEMASLTIDDPKTHTKINALINAVRVALQARVQAESGDNARLSMYSVVARMSKDSKDRSVMLQADSQRFDARREIATSLQHTMSRDVSEMRRLRRVFHLWIAAYAVTLAVSVALIIAGQHAMFLLQAGLVLFTVTVYLLVGVIRAAIARRAR